MTNFSKSSIAALAIFYPVLTSPAQALVQKQWWMEKWFCTISSTQGQPSPRVRLTFRIVPSQECDGEGCTSDADGGARLYTKAEDQDVSFWYVVSSYSRNSARASDAPRGGNTSLDLRRLPPSGNRPHMEMVQTTDGFPFTYECQTLDYKPRLQRPGNMISRELVTPGAGFGALIGQ
jgi:hypothetical protein